MEWMTFFLFNNTMKLLYIVHEHFSTIGHCKPNDVEENYDTFSIELNINKVNKIYLDLKSLS